MYRVSNAYEITLAVATFTMATMMGDHFLNFFFGVFTYVFGRVFYHYNRARIIQITDRIKRLIGKK